MPFEGPIPVVADPCVEIPASEAAFRAAVVARTWEMEERLRWTGWCQNRLDDGYGRRCFVGSMYADRAVGANIGFDLVNTAICKAAEKHTVGRRVVHWNDKKGRTVDEVFDLIGKVRAEFEPWR